MKFKSFTYSASGLLLLLASCSTPQNITYFPELKTGDIVRAEKMLDIKVKPEDKLWIIVSTQDEALSNLFNLVTTQNQLGRTTSATKTMDDTSNQGSGQVSYYTVDSQGNINFPVLGKIHVSGLNREQIAKKITSDLISADLVKDPIVTVEFGNIGISIIGEVNRPGRYEFNKDHFTIIDAIAMAGDLKINGERTNILVMRNNGDGNQEAYRLNLLNAQELASSPAYYLQQDDVVYIEPNDKVKRETTPNGNTPFTASFWITLGSLAVTIASLVITLTK